MPSRRTIFRWAIAIPAAVGGCATTGTRPRGSVVVIGGGFGGATAARHLALASGGSMKVTLVESDAAFISCPLSNLVVGGSREIAELTIGYDGLAKRGVDIVRDTAVAVDAEKRIVRLESGAALTYDRLLLSPGVDFVYDGIAGLERADARARVPHGWKAGTQTLLLRRQLEAMRDGGVFAIVVPHAPYRCLTAPYERACQAAWYFRRAKPRSKVLILDANEDVVAEKALFTRAWETEYKGLVEHRPYHVLTGVDVATMTARFETADDVRADVLNVIPPQRAGAIAARAGVVTANGAWCEVDFRSFESIRGGGIHVIGDAIQTAPLMPKSAQMANQHAKVAAAAIFAALRGEGPGDPPALTNACYSFVTDRDAGRIASMHRYDRAEKTFVVTPGSSDMSAAGTAALGEQAFAWARDIWRDMLA